ncbi:hypothetical protein [Leptospira levettii]|uniref:hypothetical protein n=1 Tax=Leptospira levettii TaxID=2023178 RepID=UPI00223E1DF6|nr:hypothetical protein [Leptospira levettii]MCW7475582.1 hypothetical protein [Leptospira levettii]
MIDKIKNFRIEELPFYSLSMKIQNRKTITLNDFLPNIYTNYYRIPFYYDVLTKFPFEEFIGNPSTLFESQKNDKFLREKNIYGSLNPKLLTTFSEKDLPPFSFENINVSNSEKFWKSTAFKINNNKTLERYKQILSILLSETQALIYISEYWDREIKDFPLEENAVFKANLEYLIQILNDINFDLTAYIFDISYQWCFLTIFDWDYTPILAVNKKVNDTNLQSIVADLIEVDQSYIIFNN